MSSEHCALAIVNQVSSAGDVALNIAGLVTTGGTANAALTAARSAGRTAGRKALSASARKAAIADAKKRLAPWIQRQRLLGKASGWWDKAGSAEQVAELLCDSRPCRSRTHGRGNQVAFAAADRGGLGRRGRLFRYFK